MSARPGAAEELRRGTTHARSTFPDRRRYSGGHLDWRRTRDHRDRSVAPPNHPPGPRGTLRDWLRDTLGTGSTDWAPPHLALTANQD